MNDDEWPESAGQSGPSEDDERKDIGRSEESDGERNGDYREGAEAFGAHAVAEFEVVTENGGATEDLRIDGGNGGGEDSTENDTDGNARKEILRERGQGELGVERGGLGNVEARGQSDDESHGEEESTPEEIVEPGFAHVL